MKEIDLKHTTKAELYAALTETDAKAEAAVEENSTLKHCLKDQLQKLKELAALCEEAQRDARFEHERAKWCYDHPWKHLWKHLWRHIPHD